MNRMMALLSLQIAAFWSVWQWYAKRFAAGNPDDQWCLLAAVTALAFLRLERRDLVHPQPAGRALDRHQLTLKGISLASHCPQAAGAPHPPQPKAQGQSHCPQDAGAPNGWLLSTVLMLLYAATFHWLPPLLRAVLAVTAVSVTMSQCLSGRALRPAMGGLFVLALPVIPLLQFYLGYPLRVVVGSITAPLLQLSGVAVAREGTSLNWSGQLISIDAPCSGIKMLWAGMFLCCAVAWFTRLSASKTLLAGLISLVVIVVGNILRASSLFYLEAEIVRLPINPNIAHDGVGVVTFIFIAIGIVASIRWLQRWQFPQPNSLCEAAPRSFSPVS